MPTSIVTTDAVLNAALAQFLGSMAMYMPLLIAWGFRILGAVTFVGFGYAVIQAVSHQDWFGTIMAFGWGVVRIAIVYVVMANLELWGSAFPVHGPDHRNASLGTLPIHHHTISIVRLRVEHNFHAV